tara:strand:- start:4514 stop:5443 length:930 start_codon:yes stop_codon:yes gene_type:complete
MRSILAVLLSALLLAPMGTLAETGTIWLDAREQQDAGTFGGLKLSMGNRTVDSTTSEDYLDLPNIVEVYTATWCVNCVTSEEAMSEAVEDVDTVLIHYHRVWTEPEDPFGSDSTEERWVEYYGESSKSVVGEERIAPSLVVDGQRLHTGSRAKGVSLVDDYSQSLQVGNRAWFTGGTIDFSVTFTEAGASFSWNFDNLVFSCVDNCPTQTTTPWILFVEDSANFDEGSNNLEDYLHVNHEANQISGTNGTAILDVPETWDGEDMKAVLLIDWKIEKEGGNSFHDSLPGIGISTLFSLLLAVPLVRSRRQ